jgi:Zn-finger protein
MLDKYRNEHIKRIIKATDNLFLEQASICRKCHATHGDLNCLFCYCPLYDDFECGGNFIILDNGLKDCSACLVPHSEEFIREYLIGNKPEKKHKIYNPVTKKWYDIRERSSKYMRRRWIK